MSAVPLPTRRSIQEHTESAMESIKNPDWLRIGVGASLLTGSLLLLTGKRKAGLLVTVAGTALAMLEHREVVAELVAQAAAVGGKLRVAGRRELSADLLC